MTTHARTCIRCGVTYEPRMVERAFRCKAGSMHTARFARVCRYCKQEESDRKKARDRWPGKARDTIRRHALRLGIPREVLIKRYGWEADRLAHEAKHQYGNGCGYCGEPYRDMGHGLADITLDVIDRTKPPHYRTNTKWCCQTCNREKGKLAPDDFELNRETWAFRTEQRALSAEERGMLFDVA